MAIENGASAIGLVARMPSGPGPISDELIRQYYPDRVLIIIGDLRRP
jgi:hypothetical protein